MFCFIADFWRNPFTLGFFKGKITDSSWPCPKDLFCIWVSTSWMVLRGASGAQGIAGSLAADLRKKGCTRPLQKDLADWVLSTQTKHLMKPKVSVVYGLRYQAGALKQSCWHFPKVEILLPEGEVLRDPHYQKLSDDDCMFMQSSYLRGKHRWPFHIFVYPLVRSTVSSLPKELPLTQAVRSLPSEDVACHF